MGRTGTATRPTFWFLPFTDCWSLAPQRIVPRRRVAGHTVNSWRYEPRASWVVIHSQVEPERLKARGVVTTEKVRADGATLMWRVSFRNLPPTQQAPKQPNYFLTPTMNLNFSKPMSADYAHLVVTKANKKHATAPHKKQLSKDSSKNTPIDLLDSTSTMTVDSTVSVSELTQDQDQGAVAQRKKTWWRQLVLSQSMFAMLKAPGRRG